MADLEKLNLPALRELARKLDIPNRSKLRKAELVLALIAAQGGVATSGTAAIRNERSKKTLAATAQQAQGSSATSTVAQAPTPSHGPHGDPGLPLPESYGRDCVVLMVQDPDHIYAWWELTGGGLETLRARCGDDATMILILRGPHGEEQRVVDFAAGNYYLNVAPEQDYQVALALRDAQGTIHLLAESHRVRTPPAGASDRLDEEWMAVDETFSELLSRAAIGDESLSSAARLRNQQQRNWAQTPVHPWFSGHIMGPPSSLSLSSTSLSSAHLQRES